MIKVELSKLNVVEQSGVNYLNILPHLGKKHIATLKAVYDYRETIHLNRLVVLPDYRGNGIAHAMLDRLVAWSENIDATQILASTSANVLELDTVEHVLNYLTKYGFSVNGNSATFDLTE